MKKSLKTLLPILLLTGLLFGLSMTASAADSGKRGDWINSPNGWWFQCTDGTYPKNGLYEVNGTAYAFDANGYMVTGWHFFSDYWFYFKDSGAMQKGWVWDKASNAWYYLDPQYGYMYSDGVRYINGTRYAFTPSGQMVTGWYYETWYSESAQATVGDWCFFNADGTAYNGWLWDDASNAWYYLSHNKMLRGLYEIDGYIFYFDGSGRMATGWTYTDTGFWYHFTGTGAADLGWIWDETFYSWYYLDPTNAYLYTNGTYNIDGTLYTFDHTGAWIQ